MRTIGSSVPAETRAAVPNLVVAVACLAAVPNLAVAVAFPAAAMALPVAESVRPM
jgi:hypothetical protein